MLYLLLAIAIGIGATVYLIKKGKIKDADGDFIPDVIEDKVEDIKEDVQETAKKIKLHVDEVKEDLGEFVEEVKDIPAKITRKKPGPKKPRARKSSGGGTAAVNKPEGTPAAKRSNKNQK